MVYNESPFALITWDEADEIASIAWRGVYADGEDYRRVLSSLAELIEQKKAARLLVDTRKAKVVTADDQAWVADVWTPRVMKGGMKYTALLVPVSSVAKLSLDRMRAKYTPPSGGGTEYFTDVDEAKTWLRSTPR